MGRRWKSVRFDSSDNGSEDALGLSILCHGESLGDIFERSSVLEGEREHHGGIASGGVESGSEARCGLVADTLDEDLTELCHGEIVETDCDEVFLTAERELEGIAGAAIW